MAIGDENSQFYRVLADLGGWRRTVARGSWRTPSPPVLPCLTFSDGLEPAQKPHNHGFAGRDPLDLAHGENEISVVVVANLTGVEWAVTKTTTVRLSAAVMTTIKSLTTEHPEFGQTYPSPSATRASGSVDAIVKWFNAEKGFGFVAVVGGSEAFMHIRQLEAAGHGSVPEGARVKVGIRPGPEGP